MSLPIIVINGFIFWPKLTGSSCGTIYFDGYVRYTQGRIWTDDDTTKQLQSMLRLWTAWRHVIVHEKHEKHERNENHEICPVKTLKDMRTAFRVFRAFRGQIP
jgi:hypothetical protein